MALDDSQGPDPALLRRAARGDPAATGELYRLFGARIYSLAVRMLASREAAEDVVHDVFVALPGVLGQFRGEGPFWAWLRRVAVTQILMRLRAERTRPRLVAWTDDAGADDVADEASAGHIERLLLGRTLESALAKLTPVSRAVVWLHDVEGWTHQEIAVEMQQTPSFSKSQLARAHARLRDLLAPGATVAPNARDAPEGNGRDNDTPRPGSVARPA
jgi:RNA polymerase sigma factor (sigma-70 family)